MRIRRRAPVPLTSLAELLALLRSSCALPDAVLARLERRYAGRTPELRRWLDELVQANLATPFQAEMLLEGRGAELVLGPYRILDWLGAGGMGQVYKAEHILMKRLVALKVMAGEPPPANHRRPITFPTPFQVPHAAFLREVQAAARLQHPNIVMAFDAAEIDGLLVLVMEYIDGIDLERLVVQRGPLPVALACEYVRQAALGLQYAQERGLIHGDVKPSNLLVGGDASPSPDITDTTDKRGVLSVVSVMSPNSGLRAHRAPRVKLLDLGLARMAGRLLEDCPTTDRTIQGQPTGLAGTPDFMAPELAHPGGQATIRSDLYSLGCTFYYLLAGRPPFPGDSWTEKLLHHQFDLPPSLRTLRPDVPAAIDLLIRRLLAKDPAERPAEPGELATLLDNWLTVHSADEPAGPTSHVEVTLPADAEELADEAAATGTGPIYLDVTTSSAEFIDLEPAADVPAEAPEVEESEASSFVEIGPEPRRWLRGTLAVLVAIGAGLAVAAFLRWNMTGQPLESAGIVPTRLPAPAPMIAVPKPFQLSSTREEHATLAAAIERARDGDTIVIHGDGPFLTGPLSWRGKSLTLRAAAGCRPRLVLEPPSSADWVPPMLTTDRPLLVEGVDLHGPQAGGLTHLVYCNGGALMLRSCMLQAPRGSALVVCRRTGAVELSDCRIRAGALAICVEAGEETTCEVHLRRTTIHIEEARAAALSIWASESSRPQPVRLLLEANTIHADRVASFRALSGGLEIAAEGNQFCYREALLSFQGFAEPDGWRRAVRWRGQENVYQGAAGWIQVDGVPLAVRSLEEWQALWQEPEPGSTANPLSAEARYGPPGQN